MKKIISTNFLSVAYVKLWYQILRARADKPVLLKLLKKATAGFVAVTDAPANHFIPELLELYPDAIVVCVSRDPIKWWASWSAVVAKATPSWLKVVYMSSYEDLHGG
jgi:hypothetical protein